jgi:2'-5' RNA ligase
MAGKYFFGFHVTGDASTSVLETVAKLKDSIPDATWTSKDKLHVTILFAGNSVRGGEGISQMEQLCRKTPPLRLQFKGAGTFNSMNGPRVLFARPVQHDVLKHWHHELGGDPSTFTPHLTLAKMESGAAAEFPVLAQQLVRHDFGSCFVDELRLYQTMGDGNPYRVVAWHKLIGTGPHETYDIPF